MKKTLSLIFTVLISLFLCSCSNTFPSETYFIHAIGFDYDSEKDEYTVLAVCEKLSDNDEEFLTISAKSDNIKSAANEILSKYKDCYFATSKYYFFEENISENALKTIATQLSDSNIYPTQSSVLCLSDVSLRKFFDSIKGIENLQKIEKLQGKNNVNCITFLSKITSRKSIKIPSLTNKNGIKKVKSVTFPATKEKNIS